MEHIQAFSKRSSVDYDAEEKSIDIKDKIDIVGSSNEDERRQIKYENVNDYKDAETRNCYETCSDVMSISEVPDSFGFFSSNEETKIEIPSRICKDIDVVDHVEQGNVETKDNLTSVPVCLVIYKSSEGYIHPSVGISENKVIKSGTYSYKFEERTETSESGSDSNKNEGESDNFEIVTGICEETRTNSLACGKVEGKSNKIDIKLGTKACEVKSRKEQKIGSELREKQKAIVPCQNSLNIQFETETCERPSQEEIHSSQSNLRTHVMSHTEDQQFQCVAPGKITEKRNMKAHLRTYIRKKSLKCKICTYVCRYNSRLKLHMMIHTGKKRFTCDTCGFECTYKSGLKTHIMSHTGERPYECGICGYKYIANTNLKKHMRIHTGEKRYQCEICGIKFTHYGSLETHRRKHTGEVSYKCEICKYNFTTCSRLESHMRRHKTEKVNPRAVLKLFECDVCGHKCTERRNFQNHIKVHTDDPRGGHKIPEKEKNYLCEICGHRCFVLGHLEQHIRTHTGEKPYECEICRRKFAHSYNFKQHWKIHHAEKSFQCAICLYKCTRKNVLKMHIRNHK